MLHIGFKNNKTMKYLTFLFLAIAIFSGSAAAAVKLGFIDIAASSGQSANSVSSDSEQISSESSSQSGATEEIVYNKPAYMKAVNLTPGVDFLIGESPDAAAIKSQIDSFFTKLGEYEINTIVLNVNGKGKMLYVSDIFPCYNNLTDESGNVFDILNYVIGKAKESGIFLYLKYDLNSIVKDGVIAQSSTIDTVMRDETSECVKELVTKYNFDALILDGYYNLLDGADYGSYRAEGAGTGLENWMRSTTEGLLETAVDTVRTYNKAVQVGLNTDPVWAYSYAVQGGIDGSGAFQAYSDGFCDTKKLIDAKLFDFLMIDNFGSLTDSTTPFERVASWWANTYKDVGIPLYLNLANEKICTGAQGWGAPDQLARQLVTASKYATYQGISFSSLSALTENRQGSTTAVLKYFDGKLNNDSLFKDLTLYQPTKTKFTTYEDKVIFYGQSDPNFEILLNGNKVAINEKGDFAAQVSLSPGNNTAVFEHKGTRVTYTIFRKVQLIKDVSPTGTVNANGGTTMAVTVTAYRGAKVTAKINGTTISLNQNDGNDLDPNSMYTKFVGTYTLPNAKTVAQNIGGISIYATWSGTSETAAGAQIIVNKLPDTALAGQMVEVNKTSAEVFPTATADDYNSPVEFYMPRGTVDYVVGDPVTYTTEGTPHTYYILKSGKRMYTTDVTPVNDRVYTNNTITAISANVSTTHTDIVVRNSWKVPFSCDASPISISANGSVTSYNANTVTLTFYYTGAASGTPNVSASPLFSSTSAWSFSEENGVTKARLTLSLKQTGKFYGLSSFYDGSGNLVLRFTNPAPLQVAGNEYGYTLNGAKIYIDSGHGNYDSGAVNLNVTHLGGPLFEKNINWSLSNKITDILRSLGADVCLTNTQTNYYSLDARIAAAQSYGPNLFIAVHHNAGSATARGPEDYYFSPFSMTLADKVVNRIAGVFTNSIYGTNVNRGDDFGLYRVTRYLDFPSILVEYGFMSNNTEASFLIRDDIQNEFAKATVRGIIDYYK